MSAAAPHQPGSSFEPDPPGASWPEIVQRYVLSLRFGMVEIVVHEGRVTQIERTEKVRLDHRAAATPNRAPATPTSAD